MKKLLLIAVGLLSASPAWASISFDQASPQPAGTTIAIFCTVGDTISSFNSAGVIASQGLCPNGSYGYESTPLADTYTYLECDSTVSGATCDENTISAMQADLGYISSNTFTWTGGLSFDPPSPQYNGLAVIPTCSPAADTFLLYNESGNIDPASPNGCNGASNFTFGFPITYTVVECDSLAATSQCATAQTDLPTLSLARLDTGYISEASYQFIPIPNDTIFGSIFDRPNASNFLSAASDWSAGLTIHGFGDTGLIEIIAGVLIAGLFVAAIMRAMIKSGKKVLGSGRHI